MIFVTDCLVAHRLMLTEWRFAHLLGKRPLCLTPESSKRIFFQRADELLQDSPCRECRTGRSLRVILAAKQLLECYKCIVATIARALLKPSFPSCC